MIRHDLSQLALDHLDRGQTMQECAHRQSCAILGGCELTQLTLHSCCSLFSLLLSCCAVLRLPHLSSATLQSLRESSWSVAMHHFHHSQYSACMAWLQRYAKRFHVDSTESDVRAIRAMAIVAMEVRLQMSSGERKEDGDENH